MKKIIPDRFLNKIFLLLLFVLAASIVFKAIDYLLLSSGPIKVIPVDESPVNARLLDPMVEINGTSFRVEIADESLEHTKGLSGRNPIQPYEGMLFVFERADYYKFWMRDMRFDLDLIYIKNDEIVDIIHNASSDLEKQENIIAPKDRANIVLEVLAGTAQTHKFQVGDKVTYRNMKLINR